MEGLEEKLNQILGDPDSMAQLMSLAQSLGGGEKSAASPPPPVNDGFVQGIMGLMQQATQTDGKQEALLNALKPYLHPDRREKLDRALRIARISQLAGGALKNYGDLLGKQGE